MGLTIITTKLLKSGTFKDELFGELSYEITQAGASFNFIPLLPSGLKKISVYNNGNEVIDFKNLSTTSQTFLNAQKKSAKLPFGYRYGFLILLGLMASLIVYGLSAQYFKKQRIYPEAEISEQIKENAKFSIYVMDPVTVKVSGVYYIIDKISGDSAFCKTVATKGDLTVADFEKSPDNWNPQNLPVQIFSVENLKRRAVYEYTKEEGRKPTRYSVAAVFK